MIRVYLRHCRKAFQGPNTMNCSRGMRIWAERHNINYTLFLQEGLPVEVLEATGDAFALEACRLAREEHAKQGVSNGQ